MHDGLAYELVLPDVQPRGGVVILHGAGSSKENHRDFAQACARAGLAALVFDQRGHGASRGALDGRALDDVATMAGRLPAGVPVFLRGSSMGGFVALAAAALTGAAGVVAICPAGGEMLLAGLRSGRFDFRADRAGLEPLLASVDLDAAARRLGPRLLLVHAEGDESVPIAHSRRLHAAAAGSRLLAVPGGDHRSAQHDPALQAAAIDFIVALAEGA
jgi:pimeloyl-ACP methyl ester carboxylesterase